MVACRQSSPGGAACGDRPYLHVFGFCALVYPTALATNILIRHPAVVISHIGRNFTSIATHTGPLLHIYNGGYFTCVNAHAGAHAFTDASIHAGDWDALARSD